MLPVVDRPMIEHVMGKLADTGADDVVLSLGYRPDHFSAAYPLGSCCGVGLRYATEPRPLGTAGAIRFAARSIRAQNGAADPFASTFWALNGDVLTDAPLGDLLGLHRKRGAEATILVTPVEDASRYGLVEVGRSGRVKRFVEKPATGSNSPGWINAGVYVLEPSVLDRIPPGAAVSLERETFAALAADGSLYAMASEEYWIDAGTPASYLRANIDLVSGRRGMTLSAFGRHVRVAPDAEVTDSVVMDRAVVERGARLAGSVVLPGGRIGAGAQVSDSVVGHEAQVGPGARVSAFALLGDHSAVPAGEVLSGAHRMAAGAGELAEKVLSRLPE